MTKDEIEAKLKEIFAAVLELEEQAITADLNPDTCEKWDSLNHIHLMTAIDETFSIELEIEQQVEIMTFDLAIDVVSEALASG